jgi:hypothetical protein
MVQESHEVSVWPLADFMWSHLPVPSPWRAIAISGRESSSGESCASIALYILTSKPVKSK